MAQQPQTPSANQDEKHKGAPVDHAAGRSSARKLEEAAQTKAAQITSAAERDAKVIRDAAEKDAQKILQAAEAEARKTRKATEAEARATELANLEAREAEKAARVEAERIKEVAVLATRHREAERQLPNPFGFPKEQLEATTRFTEAIWERNLQLVAGMVPAYLDVYEQAGRELLATGRLRPRD